MANVVRLTKRTNFSEFVRYELTDLQILFFTAETGSTPVVIPKHLFENWLGESGKLAYIESFYHPIVGRKIQTYAHAIAAEYWSYQLREIIVDDLREYLSTLQTLKPF